MVKNLLFGFACLLVLTSRSAVIYADLIDEMDGAEERSKDQIENDKPTLEQAPDEKTDKNTPNNVISNKQKKQKSEKINATEKSNSDKSINQSTNQETLKKEDKPNIRNEDIPVQFEGEGFSGFRKQGTVELLKNVKITQGDFGLEADRAKVFFDTSTDEVKTVIASGHVRVRKKDPKSGELIMADSDVAEFAAKDQIVTLKGHAKLVRGKDVIKGAVIQYDMKTGWIKADKVQGVVQPQEVQSK